MNKKIRNTILALAAVAACVVLLWINNFYTKSGVVKNVEINSAQYIYTIEDNAGMVWTFPIWVVNNPPFQKGDKVKIIFNNHGTDFIDDDTIQDVFKAK